MHAVFVTARIDDMERARQELHDRVVPAVAQEPGLVAGYWIPPARPGGTSNAVMVFESEGAAQAAAERYQPPSAVTIESIEVREVAAHT